MTFGSEVSIGKLSEMDWWIENHAAYQINMFVKNFCGIFQMD